MKDELFARNYVRFSLLVFRVIKAPIRWRGWYKNGEINVLHLF